MERALQFGANRVEPEVRRLGDMRDVVSGGGDPGRELYYMYRDLALSRGDRSIILDSRLRYDITVIPPGNIGPEYVKTAGHYHPEVPGAGCTYPEVYEVLRGTAHYVLQKREGGRITDVAVVEAGEGDHVVIPPGYGHVTVNPSNRELAMANWVSRDFESLYGPYQKCGGAAYFELAGGGLVPNGRYGPVPGARRLRPPSFRKVGLGRGKEMYGLVRDIEKLEFLNRPRDYADMWQEALADKYAIGPGAAPS